MASKGNRGANGSNGSKWIRPAKRRAIYVRDGWSCLWCGAGVSRIVAGATCPGFNATLDHFLPRSRGGCNLSTNVFTACLTCNSERGDLSALDFASHIAEREIHEGPGATHRRVLLRGDILERILEALDHPVESPRTLARAVSLLANHL